MNNDVQPFVTIIMPVLNEAAYIKDSLTAILAQDYPSEYLEILVVDGGSSDTTREIVQGMLRSHLHVCLHDNPRRIQAAALNIGILAAQGDIIIRVDGHTIIAADYISKCVEYLVKGKADNVGGLMHPRGSNYVGQGIALATTSPFGVGGSKFHYSKCEQYVDTVYLGAFWRKTFDQIGLYDESLAINEDYELNYRLRKAGGKILLSPDIKSVYTPRASLLSLWYQYLRYGRWKVRTLQKHPDSLRWRQAASPLFISTFFGSLLLSFLWFPIIWLFIFVLVSYLLANLVASTIAAKRGGWRYLFILPVVFACIHFAWGLGFWYGLFLIPFAARS